MFANEFLRKKQVRLDQEERPLESRRQPPSHGDADLHRATTRLEAYLRRATRPG